MKTKHISLYLYRGLHEDTGHGTDLGLVFIGQKVFVQSILYNIIIHVNRPDISLPIPIYMYIQRFPFGLSRLILQYILYSKNEEKSRLDFYYMKIKHYKTRDFSCQHQKSLDFERKSRKLLSGKIKCDYPKGNRCRFGPRSFSLRAQSGE